jgi:hypothetical protein
VWFEWDRRKGSLNWAKHGIRFIDAEEVFFDLYAITMPDESRGEVRYTTIGRDMADRVLVVVYTWRQKRIRIISARTADRQERRQYEG